ncbi:hypothetical protein [Christiangramia sp. SM2212]|uniref:Uncharacterized protein n=1 Tax=Christiangramia sediminicola TaxID=3073267 RepID=A0ABU1ERW9_9FLAO|nr:hypothetical protein [Christiangramia sp. SM2212]MDR5591121.1 hypothetical protein [Christiangramia sp. SM2212]
MVHFDRLIHNIVSNKNIEKTKCICSTAFFQAITDSDKDFANKYLKGSISAFTPNYTKVEDFPTEYLNGTINYLPFVQNPNFNLGLTSFFNNSITSEYRTEYNCELSRMYDFPTLPSRLSSCYAFSDFETCKLVSNRYGWNINTVKKFKLISHKYNKVAKVNMEIISLERYANNVSSIDITTQDMIWKSYWGGKKSIELELPTINGREKFKSGLIWEYLVEGILSLVEE